MPARKGNGADHSGGPRLVVDQDMRTPDPDEVDTNPGLAMKVTLIGIVRELRNLKGTMRALVVAGVVQTVALVVFLAFLAWTR